MSYRAPVQDQLFILREVLDLESHSNLPGFADAPLDLVESILTEGAKFCEEVLAPLNKVGDKEGCAWSPDNTVTTPTGFKAAFKTMVDAGWGARHFAVHRAEIHPRPGRRRRTPQRRRQMRRP